MEEQDKARELEVLEEQELEEIRETLNDEDRSWEQIKSSARSVNARSSLEVGSSVKREKNGQGAGVRKRRRLKYNVVEDDRGALKGEKQPQRELEVRNVDQKQRWVVEQLGPT